MKHLFDKNQRGPAVRTMCAAVLLSAAVSTTVLAEDAAGGIKNRTIGYALTDASWSLLQTADGKTECPQGFNEGPREQFKALYPNGGTVEGTQLAREAVARYPMDQQDKFPYREATGKQAIGLNLDGKVGPNDFSSQAGEAGVDNQLFRAIGCTRLFRAPDGTYAHFTNMWVREMNFNRILFEIGDVDSLANDDSVTVTLYRGLDRLMTDATAANIMPGGTNRVDERFGKRFVRHLKGRITDGVLTTEAVDVEWPWAVFLGRPGTYSFRGLRLNVKLTPTGGEGLVGGYADVESWYAQLVRSWSTHHSSYGGLSQPSLYPVLHRLADGYPDENGKMTAISSSLSVKLVQVFIEHGAGNQIVQNDQARQLKH
jgi:hypothetical protein